MSFAETIHEGIMYSYNQCDYQATRQVYLQGHIQSIHKHQCNQCNYQGTQKGILQKHIQSKH